MKLANGRLEEEMKRADIQPTQDFMVIQKVERKGKIELLSSSAKEATVFKVLSVGPGYYQSEQFIVPVVKSGDHVFIVGNVYEMEHEGHTYVLARAREVIGVIK